MPHAQCPMPNTSLREAAPTTSLRDATRTLSTSAQCPILLYERLRQRLRSVQVPNAQCPMPHAQCPMPHALIQKGGNSLRIVNRI
jgi:hypothetical protein